MNSDGQPSSKKPKFDPSLGSVERLDALQNTLEQYQDEVAFKILQIEREYNLKRKPIYKNRQEIIDGIHGFWSQSFCNHETLQHLLEPIDKEILQYLTELSVDESEDIKSGYTISLFFKENPYFYNNCLSKAFKFNDEGETSIVPTQIEWIDPELPTQYPSSWFVDWFSEDSTNADDVVADVIRENLWTNPLQAFLSVLTDPDE